METVKHKINKEEGELLVAMIAPMAASLIAPGASSLILLIASFINAITEKKTRRCISLMIILAFDDKNPGEEQDIIWIVCIKILSSALFFKQHLE